MLYLTLYHISTQGTKKKTVGDTTKTGNNRDLSFSSLEKYYPQEM